MSGSLRSGLIDCARWRAYCLESRPRIGSSGGNAGSPRPLRELVDLDAAILCHYWLFYFDAPVGQVRQRDEPAFFLHSAHELLRDIAAIEPIVGSHDRVVPVLAATQRLLLRVHQLPQGRREVGLAEDFTRFRRFARLP